MKVFRYKKGIVLLLIGLFLLALVLAGCSGKPQSPSTGQGAKEEKPTVKFPEKPLTLIVAYGAGGGTDITARLLAAHLEKELGQPVNVINVTGGGGWNGWSQLAHSKPDGYTIGYINVPNIFPGYLDPKVKRPENLESFAVIMNHVTDPCIWAVKGDSKYKSLQELLDDAKKNPEKISFAAHGVGGDDHLALLQVEKVTGAKFKVVHNDSTSISITQVLGGHVQVLGANVSEVFNQHKKGELRVLGVMAEKRSEFLPDVPTFKEQGLNVIMSVSRGIAAPAGTPKEILDILTSALDKATKNPEHIAKAKELGLALDPIKGEDYKKFLKAEEQRIKELMGW
ncbi:Tripartite-type tricarboxylate transporter, receptor component TctC [Thermanaeromonas toyohensis ToBE]|uniref:Tripartite-type tricarboxylate transporter, receptor component TctC n=1 Tax=Thermanaeromonas toyohensis ToBE TaxID=698762 RepID=A0A1W1VJU3_9FIRM|nr:tripartite tricarboxylate transporter substrate binding protein [Thermanaeromonas toyohensis]SMB93645.1 Tripartite-type tricarboxylate transporter, receptor component TctC [Thermanaeromonas toyohensis ToBE]